MTPRLGWLVALGLLAGCGLAVLKDPFAGLTPGACTQDADCVVAACPNACNRGQPYCVYPPVLARADVVQRCPCFTTPTASNCAQPTGEVCGPQPGCAGPFDVDQVVPRCVMGTCAARFTDGGVVPMGGD